VCCGTGTIGLCVAASNERVKKVVGVELCKAAVADAKRNATLNNQGDTAHFFAAKAEAM
jgi:tRNA/tmRNA/rRNA uracil-C5-methylase (TrmA/RlmC/RlmD family)